MATPEFDVYLAVLGRMLRLSKSESRELTAELSDHFEERLADLLDAGVDRSRAVRLVLDEFGEAAELAARFTDLASMRQRRRWIMRATVGSCLAATAVAALVLFSPGPQPIVNVVQAQNTPGAGAPPTGTPGAPNADAKAEGASAAPAAGGLLPGQGPSSGFRAGAFAGGAAVGGAAVGGFRPTTSTPVDPTAKRIELSLTVELADIDLHETPLREILEFIRDRAEVDIVVDRLSLEQAGIDETATYSLHLTKSQVTASTVLQLLVEQLGSDFDFVVRNGVVVIAERSTLDTTRIYDCRGVIQRVGDVQPIIDAIRRNVSPDTWRSNGSLVGPYAGAIGGSAGGGEGMMAGGMPGGMGGATPAVRSSSLEGSSGGMGGGPDSSLDDQGKTAAISAVGGLLVITQSPAAHRQIADLLTQLDAVLAAQ